MSRGRQKVSFEGLLQENVLGTFKIIRGFADLYDLAEVSVTMPYQGGKNGQGTGYQRQLDEQHVEEIKRFLSKGRYRFFLEIVLSLRSKGSNDPVVSYAKGIKDSRHTCVRSTLLTGVTKTKGLPRFPRRNLHLTERSTKQDRSTYLKGDTWFKYKVFLRKNYS
jgi:hypothetical protein